MADTLTVGVGFIVTDITGSVLTSKLPLNFDAPVPTHLVNVTRNESVAISSTTTDASALVLTIDVGSLPGGWLVGDRYVQAISAASKDFIHTSLLSAHNAAVDGDIIIVTPRELVEGDFISPTTPPSGLADNTSVTIRAYSPRLMIPIIRSGFYGIRAFGSNFFEDLWFPDSITMDKQVTGMDGDTTILRRCMTSSWIQGNTRKRIHHLRSCIGIGGDKGMEGNFPAVVDEVYWHLAWCSRDNLTSLSQTKAIFCISLSLNDSFQGAFVAGSDFNATVGATAPGAGSLKNQDINDFKLASLNLPVGGDHRLYRMPFPLDIAGTVLKGVGTTPSGLSIADRRDFFGYLRPTTGAQTIGPINLEDHDGSEPFPGFAVAEALPGTPGLVFKSIP